MNGPLAARALLLLVVLERLLRRTRLAPDWIARVAGITAAERRRDALGPGDREGRTGWQAIAPVGAEAHGDGVRADPGVDAPIAAAGTVDSASPAVRVIRGHLDELTAEQRAAVERYLTPPADSKVLEVPPAGTSSLPLPDTLALIHPLFAEGPGYTDIEQETLDEGQRIRTAAAAYFGDIPILRIRLTFQPDEPFLSFFDPTIGGRTRGVRRHRQHRPCQRQPIRDTPRLVARRRPLLPELGSGLGGWLHEGGPRLGLGRTGRVHRAPELRPHAGRRPCVARVLHEPRRLTLRPDIRCDRLLRPGEPGGHRPVVGLPCRPH